MSFKPFIVLFFDILNFLLQNLIITLETIWQLFTTSVRDVSNDIVLITGAGSGIGRQLSFKYASLGAKVICWDIADGCNDETVKLIKEKGQSAFAYTVDVTNREKVFETASRVLREVGDVTIIINNAGLIFTRSLLQQTEMNIKRNFDVNVISHFWILQAFLPRMMERNVGHIVAMCSMAGIVATKNLVPYASSKFAVRGLMEGLRNEVFEMTNGESKIQFTTVYPFYVNNGFIDQKLLQIRYRFLTPLPTTEDVVRVTISAQKRGISEVSVPRILYFGDKFMRFFPLKVYFMYLKLTGSFMESDIQ